MCCRPMKLQSALKASNLNTRISTGSGSITMQASELSQRIKKHSAPLTRAVLF
jgi:hypothetical protein